MSKKLIAIDLDGTLLNREHKVSTRSKEYLKKLEDEGNLVVLTSMSPYGVTKNIYDEIGLKSPLVCEGGSELYFLGPDKKEIILSIDQNILKSIFKENDEGILGAFYHFKRNVFIHKRNPKLEYFYQINDKSIVHDGNFQDMDLESPNMVFTVVKNEYHDKFLETIKKYDNYVKLKLIGADLEYTLYYLTVLHINKAYSILEIMINYQINPDDVICVGDSIEDLKMLELTKYNCAMINGDPLLQEKAGYISKLDNNYDGAITFIDDVLNNRI